MRQWVAPIAIIAVAAAIGGWVWVTGGRDSGLGVATEVVGGLVVGVVFVVYEGYQRRLREREGLANTNALISQLLAEPGADLKAAAEGIPEDLWKPSDELQDSVKLLRAYTEKADLLHRLIDTDRLDRGGESTRLLVEHFKLLDEVSLSGTEWIVVSEHKSLRERVAADINRVVSSHDRLIKEISI